MTALFAGKAFGVLSLAAVGIASTALVVGVMIFTGVAGLHGLNGLPGGSGANGAGGSPGANGANGANGQPGATGATGATGPAGANGTGGSSTTWGSLTISFTLTGKTSGLAILAATCPAEGHGAYACLLTVQNTGTSTEKINGLQYAQSPALYYAGADPTMGSILLNAQSTTQFTLWFQSVQYSGSADIAVQLIVVADTTN